jgi:hypothetical protein
MAKSTFFWILSASLDFVLAPCTAILQLNVRDLGTLLPKLRAAGFTSISTGAGPEEFVGVDRKAGATAEELGG